MQYKDYYKNLGVDEKADDAAIKTAFRKLAKQYHPDKNPGDEKAEARFKEVSEAYEVLSDKEKRQKYDALRQGFHGADNAEFDPSQFGYRWSHPNGKQGYSYTTYSSGGEFSDFFDMLFGRSGRFGDKKTRDFGFDGYGYAGSAQDVEAELEISVEEAYKGGKKRVSFGMNRQKKTLDINIKPGMQDGERIKLKGQGQKGGNGQMGDLYLKVKILPGHYQLEGLNLTKEVKLMPWDAALGATIQLTTLDGKVKVKIPKGTQTGGRIRVAGKGYKNRQGQRGDLYLNVKIVNPSKLSDEQQKLYEKLREASRK